MNTREDAVKWDPAFTQQVTDKAWPVLKRYFRAEVRGLDVLPDVGGVLLVGNRSGGSLTPDVVIFGSAFYEKFGYDRPLFTLAHSQVFVGPFKKWLSQLGVIHANREQCCGRVALGRGCAGVPWRRL